MDKVIDKIKELSKNKYYVVGFVIVVLLLLFLVFRSTPEKSTEKFMRALQNGDAKTVTKLVYWDEDNGYISLNNIDTDDIIDNLIEEFEDVDFRFKVGNSVTKDKQARVRVKVKVENSKTKTAKIYLRKVSGKWKIDIIKTLKKGF